MDMQRWQKKILFVCWLGYACSYLSRTNLSIALPGMIDLFHWNKADAGMIGTMFFWAYAVGQLINGYIGDRIQSRLFVFAGLFVSAIINLWVGFSTNLIVISILWCINGYFLSTLWGPIIKTVSLWFPENKRTKIAIILSTSTIAGYLVTWGVIGQIIVKYSWRFAFRIPAVIVLLYSFIWLIKIKNRPEEVGLHNQGSIDISDSHNKKENEKVSFIKIIVNTKLWLVAITCIAQGFVKEGISLWAPTFIMDYQKISSGSVLLFTLAIPLMSLFGVFSAGWLLKRFKSNETKAITLLILLSIISGVLLFVFFKSGLFFVIILISLIATLMNGANTILLTIIPFTYDEYNRVSTVAGFLDFSSYLGAAASGLMSGIIADKIGWRYVVLAWVLFSIFGVICIIFTKSRNMNKIKESAV